MRLLKPSGYFLEMGKAELWDESKLAAFPGVNYKAFDLTEVPPERLGEMLHQIMSLIEQGTLTPLPRRLFLLQDALEAFRFMAQAKHIGKVVLVRRPVLDPKASYLVTGASGGLGKKALLSLAGLGARRLIAVSRSEVDEITKSALASQGVELRWEKLDLSSKEGLQGLGLLVDKLSGSLRGVVHSAGVLVDRLFSAQTTASFAQVFLPKMDAALILHQKTQTQHLDFFLLYSSISGTMGAAGQSNYAAANAALDALCYARHAMGLPAVSAAWGPWDGDGMLAALDEKSKKRLSAQGVAPLSPVLGMRYFENLLLERRPHVVVADINAAQMKALFMTVPPILSDLLGAASKNADTKPSGLRSSFEKIKALPQSERLGAVIKELQAATAKVMGLPRDLVEPKRPLRDLGLDSLIGVEIQNTLSQAIEKPLPRTLLLERPTIESLAMYLVEEFFDGKVAPEAPKSALASEIDELEQLLA